MTSVLGCGIWCPFWSEALLLVYGIVCVWQHSWRYVIAVGLWSCSLGHDTLIGSWHLYCIVDCYWCVALLMWCGVFIGICDCIWFVALLLGCSISVGEWHLWWDEACWDMVSIFGVWHLWCGVMWCLWYGVMWCLCWCVGSLIGFCIIQHALYCCLFLT